jgi:hypothetical protein
VLALRPFRDLRQMPVVFIGHLHAGPVNVGAALCGWPMPMIASTEVSCLIFYLLINAGSEPGP